LHDRSESEAGVWPAGGNLEDPSVARTADKSRRPDEGIRK